MDDKTRACLEKHNPWWFGKGYDKGIGRLQNYPRILKYLGTREILLLVGARRTGKSTLLLQIIGHLDVQPEAILFINLDEPLFQKQAGNPSFLGELVEEYVLRHTGIKRYYIFIDEVQNYAHWIPAVKTLYDMRRDVKIILTGSTSALLRASAITRLSGRYFHVEVHPLSFREYLAFNNVTRATMLEKKRHAGDYLRYGAFPRVVLEGDADLKQELLKNYFQTIYLMDIVYSHHLRSNQDVFDLLYFIISNVGKPFSYGSIARTLGISTDTVKEYLGYAEESYLIHFMRRYDPSVRKQLANPKKMYCLDTGLVSALSFQFSENKGRLMENLVYMALRRAGGEIFYHRRNHECDFILKEGRQITAAIQVTASLEDERTRKREVAGLLEALKAYNLREGLIITEDEKETLVIDGKRVAIVPLYEWLEQQ